MVNQSPLHDLHVQLGATMVEFAGWRMPLRYRRIHEEHAHTRSACSVFDVSHMGRLRITGAGTESLLQRICTRNLAATVVGQCKYTHVCREDGGILDDVIVSRFEDHWGMVCNAANRDKIVEWLRRHAPVGVEIVDRTLQTAMLAAQGPKTMALLEGIVPLPLAALKRYHFLTGEYFGVPYTVYHSGYTGEEGVEVVVPADAARLLTTGLLDPDGAHAADVRPAGLGARDTLRLEAAMPLYGHELTEEWDSLTAGQGWCVDLGKDFIGRDAMQRLKEQGLRRKLVGLELEGRRISRQGSAVRTGERRIGQVTSGTLSPTLGKSVAMALVDTAHTEVGTSLSVDVGRRHVPATVVRLPFYKRSA